MNVIERLKKAKMDLEDGISTGLNERAVGEVAFTSEVDNIYRTLFLQIWTDGWLLEYR